MAETAPARAPRVALRAARVVFLREASAYFDSSIAYVFGAVFLSLSGGIFMNDFFLRGRLDMSEYFRVLPFLLPLFVPAITMRSWAEERSRGTFELIMTLPLRPVEIVLGKYFAALVFYATVLLGSVPIVVMLLALGRPDVGLIVASYLGAGLLGAFFLAIGLFLSGLTREQIVAFVVTTFVCALLVLSGQEKVVEVLDGLKPSWQLGTWLYESVSSVSHYEVFTRGVVSLADAGYFAIGSVFFLLLNAVTIELAKD